MSSILRYYLEVSSLEGGWILRMDNRIGIIDLYNWDEIGSRRCSSIELLQGLSDSEAEADLSLACVVNVNFPIHIPYLISLEIFIIFTSTQAR